MKNGMMYQTKNQHWTHPDRNVSYENDVVSYEKETCNSWKREMNGELNRDNKIYWL